MSCMPGTLCFIGLELWALYNFSNKKAALNKSKFEFIVIFVDGSLQKTLRH